MAQGDWTDPALGRMTFGEYALAWLDSRADLKPKTRHQYRSLLTLHILPTWRTVPLAKITFESLSQWVARLSLGDLGPSGVRQSVFVVSAALDHAVRSGRIRSNPARGLGLPRPRRRDYVFLTHGQLRALADEAGPWRVFVLVLGYRGLRWGEATALRVCDIDLARRRIDVRRAFSDTAASLMIQAGYPPKMLQEIMEHASITTTLDLYGHLYPSDMDRYAARLDDAAGMADAAECGQMRKVTIRTQRSQRLDLGFRWRARRDSNPNLLIRRSVHHVRPVPGQSVAAGHSPSFVLFVSLRPGLSPQSVRGCERPLATIAACSAYVASPLPQPGMMT